MIAGNTVLAITPICHESGSACCSLMYIAVNIGIFIIIFKEDAGSGFLWLSDVCHIKLLHSLSVSGMLMALHPKYFLSYLQCGDYYRLHYLLTWSTRKNCTG